MPAIELAEVTKRYRGRAAVEELSLAVEPGRIYALLGPNGAGKTTTIQVLLGFVTPDAGRVRVAGVDVVAAPVAARAKVAYVPETVQLYPQLSGLENLDYFSRLAGHRLPPAGLRDGLQRAGLAPEAADRPAATYSKGMRQKVGLAIAFAKRAEVLLLDEPTSGLDPRAAHEFNALTRDVAAGGVAVLMATHDLLRAQQVAHGLGILHEGRLRVERRGDEVSLGALEQLYLDFVGAPPALGA